MAKDGQKLGGQTATVRFFGNFQVSVGAAIINDASSRARRPWSLLQYLVVCRKKPVSRQQLIEALWPGDSSEQPDKALKNLVYRVRSFFAAKGVGFAQRVILYCGGNYQLNNDLHWEIDLERFEEACQAAAYEKAPVDERIDHAVRAVELYRGDFLADQAYEDWMLPYSTYYRTLFFKCVSLALALLENTGREEDVEVICSRALAVDQFEEALHLAYINALVRQGKKTAALAHYGKMADLFFREMGVGPSDALREVYHELSRSLNNTETDLYSIKSVLSEPDASHDAFYCDFDVFRSLYRLEARTAERAGQAVFIGLLTLCGIEGELTEGEYVNKCMAALLNIIHQCLRRSDVVSRFSGTQYILMLPTVTVENAELVLNRVKERYTRNTAMPNVRLEAKLQPLDPIVSMA